MSGEQGIWGKRSGILVEKSGLRCLYGEPRIVPMVCIHPNLRDNRVIPLVSESSGSLPPCRSAGPHLTVEEVGLPLYQALR